MLSARPALANAVDLWLAPPVPTNAGEDFETIFSKSSSWQSSASQLRVLKFYLPSAAKATDAQLKIIVSGLKERRLALAIEAPVLTSLGKCLDGPNEVWTLPSRNLVPTLRRFKRLGAEVTFLAMTGPLVDGHTDTGPHPCRATLRAVAADVARTVQQVRSIYPNIVVGEIEPVGHGVNSPDWTELPEWFAALREAIGTVPAFFHADIDWGGDWQSETARIADVVGAAEIKFGVIADGNNSELSDAEWANDVARNIAQVETLLGSRLKSLVFQSWYTYPLRFLPESDVNTFTGIVLSYSRAGSELHQTSRDRVRLTDAEGNSIAGESATLSRSSVFPNIPVERIQIDGTAPSGTASALFAVRVGTECTCLDQPAKFALAALEIGQVGMTPVRRDLSEWAGAWPGMITFSPDSSGRISLQVMRSVGQRVILNTTSIPLTSGMPFTASFDLQVDPFSAGVGQVGLIFRNKDGVEFHRSMQPLVTTWKNEITLTSGEGGELQLPSEAGSTATGTIWRLDYPGNRTYKPSSLNVSR